MMPGWAITAAIASSWWANHGHPQTVCSPVRTVTVDNERMATISNAHGAPAYMATDITKCIVYINALANSDRGEPRDWAYNYCEGVLHEWGHLVGIGHREDDHAAAPYKFMDAVPDPYYAPRICSEISHFFSKR